MSKLYSILAIAIALAFTPTAAHAQGPTSTPEPMYSRSDLLARIAPKSYTISPSFTELDMMTKVTDTTIDGTSWGMTLISILQASGVQTAFIGLIILLMLVFWLRKTLLEKLNKREISPAEAQIRDFRKSFSNDLKDYRKFNKSSRRNKF